MLTEGGVDASVRLPAVEAGIDLARFPEGGEHARSVAVEVLGTSLPREVEGAAQSFPHR